jgi:hypothetical protein
MPTITRANAEAEVVGRCREWLAKAGLAVTTAGANADLAAPLRQTLALMGVALDSPTAVGDADVARLTTQDEIEEFFDRLALAAFKKARGRFAKATMMVSQGDVQIQQSDLLRQLNAIISSMEADVRLTWGQAGGAVSCGVLNLGFQATDDCQVWE